MTEIAHVPVPCRIDFAGGWTDVAEFAAHEGGLVLNAAIDRYIEGSACWTQAGLQTEYALDLPPDAHLGSSSAINTAYLRLTFELIGRSVAPVELAERVFALEHVIGEKGGKQDGYAAALGGINLLRFGKPEEPAAVEAVELTPARAHALERCLVLCDTGPGEESGDLHEEVWRHYRDGDTNIADGLRRIRDSVEPARDALVAGDMSRLGALMTENREAARRLHSGVITARMNVLFDVAEKAGAVGGKPCGAGGGGCILLLCKADRRGAVGEALQGSGGKLLAFGFAPRSST